MLGFEMVDDLEERGPAVGRTRAGWLSEMNMSYQPAGIWGVRCRDFIVGFR